VIIAFFNGLSVIDIPSKKSIKINTYPIFKFMKIICNNICKSFQNNTMTLNRDVLRGISFDLESGDSLSISGPSGAGKSTLLNIISGLDDADSGDIYFDNLCFSN
jgi:ABC-type lipoprotein export system ATPase subunit